MNKLEEKILSKIQSDDVWLDEGTLMDNILTANISAITIEFARGLNKWVLENEWWQVTDPNSTSYQMWGNMEENCEIITTDQLINEYIKTI